MEGKINIKELAKNLKNLNRPEAIQEPIAEPVIEVKEEVKSTVVEPKIVEKRVEQPKAPIEKPKQLIRNVVPENDLVTTLQSAIEEYDFSKQVWIDDEIYEILMHIKRREKIKSISVLVTSIVEQYINQNRTAIVRLLNDRPKKI
jgi:FAD synthase